MRTVGFILFAICCSSAAAAADSRELVRLPEMMQEHMLANMRDHLRSLDEILGDVAEDKWDRAADVAEQRLGISSLAAHDASHMAEFMPQAMQAMGLNMHRAASRFAVTVQEGDRSAACRGLQAITAACVACHAAYRVR
jgi:hypothetical protein